MKNNIGHNRTETETSKLIKATIEGIENYEEQKKDLSESIAEIKANAKAKGLCLKTIGKILKLRKTDPEKAKVEQAELEIYCDAVGIDLFSYKGE